MSEQLYALGDIGGTHVRVGLYNRNAFPMMAYNFPTDQEKYESALNLIESALSPDPERPIEIVAASVAIASEVGEDGALLSSGALTPWNGRNLRQDLATVLNLPVDLVGTPNDVVAIALSQQAINHDNDRAVQGIATTLSSGWGGALYFEELGKTVSDEPGHQFLRKGATCTCGEDGHTEAWVSGEGIRINKGMSIEEWLRSPIASSQLVNNLSQATVEMIERNEARVPGFEAEEIRWTGGVVLGQPFLMQRVAKAVKEAFGGGGIAFETATMGEQAGIHGTFIDAQRRAANY